MVVFFVVVERSERVAPLARFRRRDIYHGSTALKWILLLHSAVDTVDAVETSVF